MQKGLQDISRRQIGYIVSITLALVVGTYLIFILAGQMSGAFSDNRSLSVAVDGLSVSYDPILVGDAGAPSVRRNSDIESQFEYGVEVFEVRVPQVDLGAPHLKVEYRSLPDTIGSSTVAAWYLYQDGRLDPVSGVSVDIDFERWEIIERFSIESDSILVRNPHGHLGVWLDASTEFVTATNTIPIRFSVTPNTEPFMVGECSIAFSETAGYSVNFTVSEALLKTNTGNTLSPKMTRLTQSAKVGVEPYVFSYSAECKKGISARLFTSPRVPIDYTLTTVCDDGKQLKNAVSQTIFMNRRVECGDIYIEPVEEDEDEEGSDQEVEDVFGI